MKKIVLAVIAIVAFSFVGNAQSLRADFLKGKTQDEVVSSYGKLSLKEQDNLWLEKINQLLSQKMPNEQLTLIKTWQKSIINHDYNGLKSVAINLAKITPEYDFLKMVESLSDYNYTGKFIGTTNVSVNIIKDLENMPTSSTTPTIDPNGRAACTCHWCGGLGTPGTNCKPTGSGCGFMWLYACDHCMAC